MRVLLACPYAWDAPGGVQAHVRQLAAVLTARGHAVVVVAPVRSRAVGAPAVQHVGRAVGVRWQGSVAPICLSPRSFLRVRRVLRRFAPDVVHVHEPFAPSTAMLVTLAAPAPVVATFHALIERSSVMRLAAPVLGALGQRIAAPIAVSESAAAYAAGTLGARVEIIPNGVPARCFLPVRPARDVPAGRLVLWAHRLDRRKGFPIAVQAFARLARELDDVHLAVVGAGRDREALALLGERQRRRVVMLGESSDAALATYRAAADVFVAASTRHESFGVALLEAMAARLPIVASDIRGYRAVVRSGVEGLLVPPGDASALAGALRRVLTEPMLAAALGRAGRARARRYSWDVIVPRIEALYRRVVSGRAERAAPERPPGDGEQADVEEQEVGVVEL